MTELPKTIKLDAADMAVLTKFSDKQAAVQATFSQFAVAGERRMQELQEEGKHLWVNLGAKYGFDPKRVQYDIEDDQIVPKAVRL